MCSRDLKPQLISILSKKRQRLVVAEKTTTGSINQKNVAPSEILAAIWSPSTVELRQAIEIMNVICRIEEALEEQASSAFALQTALSSFSSSSAHANATTTLFAASTHSKAASFAELGTTRALLSYASVAQFDQQIADALQQCGTRANALKKLVADATTLNEQRREHLSRIVFSLYARLDNVSSRWSHVRSQRFKQLNQHQQRPPLLPDVVENEALSSLKLSTTSKTTAQTTTSNNNNNNVILPSNIVEQQQQQQRSNNNNTSNDELGMLQRENVVLREQLRSDVDAARELERSVIQVGVLQRTFAGKVAEQAEEIAHIHTTLVSATDAVSRGNEQLAQAAARAVDFRIFVLLFMIVSSFALLFIDWYHG